MDPHEPFLKAILADRHDDLPRLVYADWLEETGEPINVARAHFIRTQIALETTDPHSALYVDLKRFESELLETNLDVWQYELPEAVRPGPELERVKWRGGFPDDLGWMTAHDFLAFGAKAIRELPLTGLVLTGHDDPFMRGGGPVLHFDRHLELGLISTLRFFTSHQLVGSPDDVPELPTATFDSLMSAPVFTSLRHLDLAENFLTDAWVIRFGTAFPAASFAPTLETLDLSFNFDITNAGANVLATAPGLDGLKRLVVRDTGITKFGRDMLRKRFGARLG